MLVTHGKNYYLLRELSCHLTQNIMSSRYMKLSDIREFWKKKKYLEENIVLIQWHIHCWFWLCQFIKPVEKHNFIMVDKLIVFIALRLLLCIVCIGVLTSPQKHHPLFFGKAPLKSANSPSPPPPPFSNFHP